MRIFNTFLLLSFLFVNTAISQEAAVVGWNTDSGSAPDVDGLAIVALVDIPSTQNIFLTDMPYDPATNTFFDSGTTGDGIMQITWSGTWNKGTIIRAIETGITTDMFTVTSSANGPASPGITINNTSFSITGSEGISLFTSNTLVDPNLNIVEIYSHFQSASGDPNPNTDPDCPCSIDFVEVDLGSSSIDAANFTPGLRSGSVSLADFNNPASYTTSPTNLVLDLTEFLDITFGGSGLPVELTSFTANSKEEGTFLNWQTASEENNHYFQIEYSTDGRNFITLDKVNGMGTSVEINNYDYLHSTPQSGLNYYRLKQVDYDDAFEYSRVVSVRNEIGGIPFSVYPNPFENVVTLTFPSSEDTYVRVANRSVKVYDMFGRLVQSIEISMDETTSKIDLSQLSIGTYFIEVAIGDKSYSIQRLIKL